MYRKSHRVMPVPKYKKWNISDASVGRGHENGSLQFKNHDNKCILLIFICLNFLSSATFDNSISFETG